MTKADSMTEADVQQEAWSNVAEDKKFFNWLAKRIEQAKNRQFVFLLVGRTGVGKSTTVNTLLGEKVAPVGDYEPTTRKVARYPHRLGDIQFVVVDTPGLCDDLEEEGNDEKYLSLVHENAKEIHCLWFVTRLDDTRVTSDEKRALRLLTKAFGKQVWEHAVIVFTFAGNKQDNFAHALKERTRLIREEIGRAIKATDAKANDAIVRAIPSVAVDNCCATTPDGKQWLGELYTTTFERVTDAYTIEFLLATKDRLDTEADAQATETSSSTAEGAEESTQDGAAPKIAPDEEQQKRIRKKFRASIIKEYTTAGSAIGGAIGRLFGKKGAAIGGAIGGAGGALVGIFRWAFDW